MTEAMSPNSSWMAAIFSSYVGSVSALLGVGGGEVSKGELAAGVTGMLGSFSELDLGVRGGVLDAVASVLNIWNMSLEHAVRE